VTPDERETLEGEREFLLKSLDDLDAELVAGNIDPDTYRTLHDDYTARAAAAIHELADGVERTRAEPKRLKLVTVGGVVVFCVLLAVLLAHAVGQRQSGQTITGRQQTQTTDTLDPHTYDGQIAIAREQLRNGKYEAALSAYTAAAGLDATQPEPLAYRGWIFLLSAGQVADANTRKSLVDQAGHDFDKAITIAPKYPDAYFFQGYMLYNFDNKPADAYKALVRFENLAPQDHPLRQLVEQLIAEVARAANSSKP